MKKDDFKISITVEAGAQRVFEAINNVRGWWSQNIEGPTAALHDEFIYHYQDVHRCRIQIETMETDRKVVWRVLENYFKFTQDELIVPLSSILWKMRVQLHYISLIVGLIPRWNVIRYVMMPGRII